MIVSGKDKAKIPVGKMIYSMENMIGKRVELCESLCNTRYYIIYDKENQRAYVEERDHLNQFVSRFESFWSNKEYFSLYTAMIDLMKYCKLMYSEMYSVYGVFADKSIKSRKSLVEKVKHGMVDLYIATTVQNAFKQYAESHPYLVDDIKECTIKKIPQDDIDSIYADKMQSMKSTFEEG